jgi:hypothetical protein
MFGYVSANPDLNRLLVPVCSEHLA